jgi:membrane protease subunit HflC
VDAVPARSARARRVAGPGRAAGGQSAEILGEMEKELRQIRSEAYRRAQEVRGQADAEATRVYGAAYGQDPAFYAFSRTLEAHRDGTAGNSVLIPHDRQ